MPINLSVSSSVCRIHSTSSIDDSVTTVESSHSESDDARAPELPDEVYGSRKEPSEPSLGIYGRLRTSYYLCNCEDEG